MKIFKEQNVSVKQLLDVVSEEMLSDIGTRINVDYYTKVLSGRKLFYLLLYGIIENDRLSQRSLEDTFNDKFFKTLFSLDENETIRRSSLSERLTKVNVDYFRLIYQEIYTQFSNLYTTTEIESMNLIPVDSTLIKGYAKKMSQGFSLGGKKNKYIKFSVAFDGAFPCDVKVFTEQIHCNEHNCLPEVVLSHANKQNEKTDIYLIDRGVSSLKYMVELKKKGVSFIVRIQEGRKHVVVKEIKTEDTDLGEYIVVKDSIVNLLGRGCDFTPGCKNTHQMVVKEPFRLVVIQNKKDSEKQFWFISNKLELKACEIASAYRCRWSIEVFFRFIKQELNTKHLLSLNNNGIEVVLYMTLIASMMLMIYKRLNKTGYKTAKRRFAAELRDLIIEMIIIQCGGDPKLYKQKLIT